MSLFDHFLSHNPFNPIHKQKCHWHNGSYLVSVLDGLVALLGSGVRLGCHHVNLRVYQTRVPVPLMFMLPSLLSFGRSCGSGMCLLLPMHLRVCLLDLSSHYLLHKYLLFPQQDYIKGLNILYFSPAQDLRSHCRLWGHFVASSECDWLVGIGRGLPWRCSKLQGFVGRS